jgi:hypothetical protein
MIQVGVPVGLGSGWTRVRGARSHVACVRMDPQARCFQGGGHGMLFGARSCVQPTVSAHFSHSERALEPGAGGHV